MRRLGWGGAARESTKPVIAWLESHRGECFLRASDIDLDLIASMSEVALSGRAGARWLTVGLAEVRGRGKPPRPVSRFRWGRSNSTLLDRRNRGAIRSSVLAGLRTACALA